MKLESLVMAEHEHGLPCVSPYLNAFAVKADELFAFYCCVNCIR
jgi:hypothetical protein